MQNLAHVTDDDLAALAGDVIAADDAAALAAIEAEADRRDARDARNRRARARRAAVRSEWFHWAWAQFAAAEDACRGYLLNKAGRAAGIDPWSLWSGRSSRVARYASEELIEFWQSCPRVTVTEYAAQRRRYTLAS